VEAEDLDDKEIAGLLRMRYEETHPEPGKAVSYVQAGLGEKNSLAARGHHDAVIDFMLVNPMAKNRQIGEAFGYTAQYISRLICSDMFQAKLAERKEKFIDPVVSAGIEDRLTGLLAQSAEIIEAELEKTRSASLALSTMSILAKAGKYGAKVQAPVQVTTYVAVVPQKEQSSESWAHAYGQTVEVHRAQEE
jgi:hypothetical protein